MDSERNSYCLLASELPKTHVHRKYHDTEYGFPIESDNELFGRLILEINQAGLSWETILKKAPNFRTAFADYNINKIAAFTEDDEKILLLNAGIIRNKRKIKAVIYNAKQIQGIQKEVGSFKKWLDLHHPKSKNEWVKLFKKTFTFTGGEITNEFLLSTGYLKGAHDEQCPIFHEILKLNPPWTRV